MKQITLFVLLASVAAGCGSLPTAPVRPAVYDFGPGPLTAPATKNPALPALLLQEFRAPSALDNPAVLYRLSYADARQLRPYANARWSMPPAQLVRQRLREALGVSRAVIDAGESAAPFTLRVELQEFSQLFESEQASSGLVRLNATLFEAKGGADRLVAQRVFVVQRPAPSADAAGGVRALISATDAIVEEVGAWLRQHAAK
ncbi:MAG: ABC-type transport auxiliary lipoprotein family protein [Betaproteobacteria bacterium]